MAVRLTSEEYAKILKAPPPAEFIKKKRKRSRHEEDAIQIQCVDWFRRQAPFNLGRLLFHIPNGGSRSFRKNAKGQRFSPEAQRLKRMGIRSGVSDLFLMYPANGFHGLFVEMKSTKGVVSDEQESFMGDADVRGYAVGVARSLEEFEAIVRKYLGSSKQVPLGRTDYGKISVTPQEDRAWAERAHGDED